MTNNRELTEDTFRKLCKEVQSSLNWLSTVTSDLEGDAYDNVEGAVIDELHQRIIFEFAGNLDRSEYVDNHPAPDRKSLSEKRKQEIINIVIKLRNTYFLPGPIIDETVNDVVRDLERGGVSPGDVV